MYLVCLYVPGFVYLYATVWMSVRACVCTGMCVSRAGSSQTRSASNGQWPKPRRGWCYLSRQGSHIPLFLHLPPLVFPRPLPPAHPSPNHSWHVKRLLGPPPGLAHLATCLYLSDSRGTFIHPFIHPSLSLSLWMHAFSTLLIRREDEIIDCVCYFYS